MKQLKQLLYIYAGLIFAYAILFACAVWIVVKVLKWTGVIQ